MRRFALLVCCMIPVSAAAAAAATPKPVPVLLRADPNVDACPSFLRVKLPEGGREGFLSLRAGPGTAWPEIARLRPATSMIACSEKADWIAVIIQPGGGGDCAIPVPTGKPLRYAGPCRHGWVNRRFVETVAG
ncbi:hypothetical protein [Sphingomonas jatrophae]|uniref:Integron n=1 Tax=Sphingomonas jatrophae TaxID=1166337 RepID=A0A1I6KZH6_9SPHN|nr:hypothetical protein [Sphingomonas jatrophae]SFR96604.1 hypothetical protein SAMN05192580_2042 [Sphingomonas jatrophae]